MHSNTDVSFMLHEYYAVSCRKNNYWATLYKTFRLCYRCNCLSVCPVCIALVYCGQTVRWIKMKLVMQVER